MAYNAATEETYSYDFVEPPPDRLVCKICHLPCREAQMSECCGHVFCKTDLQAMKTSTNLSYSCPMCRVTPLHAYPNRAVDREIKELKVYCPNKKHGCG